MGPTLNADHTDSFHVPAEHGSELAARLPFDVWLAISQHLSIKDLAALRVSSRLLRALMSERSVWHSALLDVLSVKPLPHLRADVPHMSSDALRGACLRAATVEQGFTRGELAPRAVATAEGDFVQAALLPGGERFVAITARGSLELHHVGCKNALSCTPAPVPPLYAKSDIRILPKTVRDVLVLHAIHWNNDPAYDGSTDVEFRMYSVTDHFTLLRVYRPDMARNIVHYGVHYNDGNIALLYLRGRYEREYVVDVQFLGEDGLDRFVSVRLRGWIMCSYMQDFLPLFGSVSLISSSRMLLAASEGMYLYDLPPPEPTFSCQPPDTVDLKPIWTTYSRWLTRTPIISPPVTYTDPLPRARCMLWTGKDVFDLDFPLGSVTDDSRFMLHVVHTQYNHASIYLGYSTGVQYPPCSQRIPTPAFSMAFGWGCESGHLRLGREGPSVKKARMERAHVAVDGTYSEGDVSMDELSGRISILDHSTGRLQLYDVA